MKVNVSIIRPRNPYDFAGIVLNYGSPEVTEAIVTGAPVTMPPVVTAVPADLTKYYWNELKESASATIKAYMDGREVECAIWRNTGEQPYLGQGLPERGYYLVLPDEAFSGVHALRVVICDVNNAQTGDYTEKVFQMKLVDGVLQPDFSVLPMGITLEALGARGFDGTQYVYDSTAGWITVNGTVITALLPYTSVTTMGTS